MIELELFAKMVECKIREKHEQNSTIINRLLRKDKIAKKDKFLQGYNKAIEASLDILLHEYKVYEKRLKKQERELNKF